MVFSSICLLSLFSLVSGGVWGQVVLQENFLSITSGDNTSTNGSSASWNGNSNFPIISRAYQAGGAIKLGTSSNNGSITSLAMDLSSNNGFFNLSFKVKGWTTVEGNIQVYLNNTLVQTVTYASVMSGGFQNIDLNLTGGTSNTELKLQTSAKRAYLDDIVVSKIIWTGSSSNDPTVANNWSPAAVPASTASVVIPSGLTNYPNFTNNSTTSFGSITIDAGASLTLQSGAEITLTGNLTNNGTLMLENGATLVQGASSAYSGSGTVQVKQNITGGNNGNSPNGRFWYLGSPVSGGQSSILDAAGANVVKYWDEQGAAWVEITDNTSALTVGRGHYLRSYTPGNQTLTFTGGALNNGTYNIPLTANGSSFNGFNLVSNPYPSYLKWDDVAKTNVGTTIWYRTSNGANNMVFDTYNSNGNVGTSNNGAGTVSQYIPPMQAFWVKVEGSTTGNIVMENADRSHHVSGMQGMHSLLDKQMFANINLIKDTLRDQAIVYSSYTTTDIFDANDSEKMFQANTPQLYSKINDKKVVINSKNFMQRNEKTPLYLNIPSAGTYTMQLGEFNSSFGSIWLEDLSNGQLQNLLINDTYTFESEAGQDLARFVLHFGYPEQIYGTDEFESVEDNFDSPINWNDVNVVAANDKNIDLTASLNELDAQQTKTVSVFDLTGRQIMTGSFENGNNQIQVPAANAVYMVHVSVGSAHKVFKVLIQQ